MGPVKSIFSGIAGIFSPPSAPAPPSVPTPPPPPAIDPNANASAAAAGNKVRMDATADQTTFAGELGSNDTKKKRLLGF